MPLTQDQEELEHALRVEQMQTNIELMRASVDKFRADLAAQQRQFEAQQRDRDAQQRDREVQQKWETKKWIVSMVVAAAALLGAGVALGNFLTLHLQHL